MLENSHSTMAETESWLHSLSLLRYMIFHLCVWLPTKERISQAPLQLVLTLWLGSGQWDESKSDMYNRLFLTLEERNICSSSYFLPEDWNSFPFSHVDQTVWMAEHQWKSLYPWIHSGSYQPWTKRYKILSCLSPGIWDFIIATACILSNKNQEL